MDTYTDPAVRIYCYAAEDGNGDPHEVQLLISDADWHRFKVQRSTEFATLAANEVGAFVEVTDLPSNERWLVASAPCGADCRCAAVAKRADECEGHPAGPYDRMGETVYCDGSCKT